MGSVVGVIAWPAIYIRDGGASIEDINNFPRGLRRKLVVWYRAGAVLLGGASFAVVCRSIHGLG